MEDDSPKIFSGRDRRAAQTVNTMEEDIEDLWKQGTLREFPGVGENIEKKIDEILRTGKLQTLEKMKKATPVKRCFANKGGGHWPKDCETAPQGTGSEESR